MAFRFLSGLRRVFVKTEFLTLSFVLTLRREFTKTFYHQNIFIMKILIDNGHGAETPGKCSPDRRLREYKWARVAARELCKRLDALGFDAQLLVPEERDISLRERVRRANAIAAKTPSLLVSIHINAAGADGKWHDASGWSGWVAKGASKKSCHLAMLLHLEAEKRGLRGNRYVPADRCWRADFYILRHTTCPAVLTENLFMDNRRECDYLLSEAGRANLVDVHVAAIKQFMAEERKGGGA